MEELKPLKNNQLVVDPIKGDCFRACVTSLLGLPNTDKFPDAGDKEWFIKWSKYLGEMGLNIHYEEKACWRSGYWIASVKSKNFSTCTHAIIMDCQEVYHDPSPNDKYPTGLNLLGKDVVLGGWFFEVENFQKFINTRIPPATAGKSVGMDEKLAAIVKKCIWQAFENIGQNLDEPDNCNSLLVKVYLDFYEMLGKEVPKISPKSVDVGKLEKIVGKTLKPSCTCNNGTGIVCVGCFYKKDIATAIKEAMENGSV